MARKENNFKFRLYFGSSVWTLLLPVSAIMSKAHTLPRNLQERKSTWQLFLKEPFFLNPTSEGVHVPSIIRGDGIQVNAAAALSLYRVAVFT